MMAIKTKTAIVDKTGRDKLDCNSHQFNLTAPVMYKYTFLRMSQNHSKLTPKHPVLLFYHRKLAVDFKFSNLHSQVTGINEACVHDIVAFVTDLKCERFTRTRSRSC